MSDLPYSIDEQNQLAARQADQTRIKNSQDYGRLCRLLEDSDVIWLLKTHIQPIVERERLESRKLTAGQEHCWVHLHRLAVAEEIVGLLSTEHARVERLARITK